MGAESTELIGYHGERLWTFATRDEAEARCAALRKKHRTHGTVFYPEQHESGLWFIVQDTAQ